MATIAPRLERRLAAIFAADVAGYSRLMGQDEVGTLRRLGAHREVMDQLIHENGGRIANTAGDSVLAEFPSAVDAVACAVTVQEALAALNDGGDGPPLRFRIGVHVGDVMIKGGDLFGEGVNIAARLQAIADPGGVAVSDSVHAHVRKGLSLGFHDLGPQEVKNIEEPIRAYAVVQGEAAHFDLAALLGRGAGLPRDAFAMRRPEEVALLTGALLRIACENLKQLLASRNETVGIVRGTHHHLIQAAENNPLRFSPSVEDAMRIMFGPPTTSYLDAERTLREGFAELARHQATTRGAMREAVGLVMDDLAPQAIEAAAEPESGFGGLIGTRKARLWDQCLLRWRAKAERQKNGLVDVFVLCFSEAYARLAGRARP